jgi:hypothetical protein
MKIYGASLTGSTDFNPLIIGVGGITASDGFYGTASWAYNTFSSSYTDTASYAVTASYVLNVPPTAPLSLQAVTSFGNTTSASVDIFIDPYGPNNFGLGTFTHGQNIIARGTGSHAQGLITTTEGDFSHAEGERTFASGEASHAEGFKSVASGGYSHAEGNWTIAKGDYQLTVGQFNIPSLVDSAFIIGDGTSDVARHNLLYAAEGKVDVSGSLHASDITGSLWGTASWALNTVGSVATSAFPFTGSAQILGRLGVTGSVSISGSLSIRDGGLTGSVYGTASWALNALTASYIDVVGKDITVNWNGTQLQLTASVDPPFPFTGSASITGSANITGSLTISGSTTSSFTPDITVNEVVRVGRGGIGFGAGQPVTNTVVGNDSLRSNTNGCNNTAIGYKTLTFNTVGQYNTAVGHTSLHENISGIHNTSLGYSSQKNGIVASYNTSLGSYALRDNISGISNTAVGFGSLRYSYGNCNLAIGTYAGRGISSGGCNVVIGGYTAIGRDTQNCNIFISDGAGNLRQWIRGNDGSGHTEFLYPVSASFTTASQADFFGTASWALNATTASYINVTGSGLGINWNGSQLQITASATVALQGKVGNVAGGGFFGTPQTASVVFTTPFATTNFGVTITGEDPRVWSVDNKTTTGFTINSNSNVQPVNTVYWMAIPYGETI